MQAYKYFKDKLNVHKDYPDYGYKPFLEEVLESQNITKDNDFVYYNEICMRADETILALKALIVKYNALDIREGEHYKQWFDLLITASYLYEIFSGKAKKTVKDIKYSDLFKPRDLTEKIAGKHGLSKETQEFLYQTVESAMGANGPGKLKAAAGTPSECFALALFIRDNYASLLSFCQDDDENAGEQTAS